MIISHHGTQHEDEDRLQWGGGIQQCRLYISRMFIDEEERVADLSDFLKILD